MITVSALNEINHLRHGFFTRDRGVSTGLYESRNCGFGTDDNPANVLENRSRCMQELGSIGERLVTLNQVHSDRVVTVAEPWKPMEGPEADAMVTDRTNLGLGVVTADCAPVLFSDSKAGVIGAAHAGWRGAKDGVLDETVKAMESLGAKPGRITAAIGPCIAMRSYEVGPEFPAPFLEETPENQDFFAESRRENHFLFDLPGYVARRLARIGVSEVVRTPCDTVQEEGRFFSYRRARLRNERDYGRQISIVLMED